MVLRKVIMQDLDQIIALENIGFSPKKLQHERLN